MNLYYTVYVSTPTRTLDDDGLRELLKVSRDLNSRFDVTGMLICLPENYIQLIEGPKPHIDQLYNNIQRDKRHMRVTTLREGPIEQRYFPDWAMALKESPSMTVAQGLVNLEDDKVLQLFNILEY
ncbi:BLUF domain-containing protein [Mucilaginibacter lutimaris]|uniref:BLUF domain-containing protein n=1 Tax=Mucilaginibacter lutimaris TaxID=931629 RepID=A0ABW2ZAT7_9SPHI